jgi:hypothetical protein
MQNIHTLPKEVINLVSKVSPIDIRRSLEECLYYVMVQIQEICHHSCFFQRSQSQEKFGGSSLLQFKPISRDAAFSPANCGEKVEELHLVPWDVISDKVW